MLTRDAGRWLILPDDMVRWYDSSVIPRPTGERSRRSKFHYSYDSNMCEMMLDWRSTRRIMLTPSVSEIIISNTAPVMSRIYELQIGLEFQRAIGEKSEYEGMFRSCSKGHHTYLDHVDNVITLELMTSLHSMTSRGYALTLPKLS